VTHEQAAFAAGLRLERERRKITLASVAESTKISQSLLAALEHGDASRWPAGIYRRAFFREYAAAVGLSSESMLVEFLRLFPEAGAPVSSRPDSANVGSELRLVLATDRRWPHSLALQLSAAILDGFVVVTIGAAIGLSIQVPVWTAIGILAVMYYSIATALLGQSPALWLTSAIRLHRSDWSKPRIRPEPSLREPLQFPSTLPRPHVWNSPYVEPAPGFVENARSAS
jgi:transcriptional regulator with XRE-family HTH domain